MRGSVVDAQCGRAAANIDAEGFPRERLLIDALAEVTCEEEAVPLIGAEGCKEPKLGNSDILTLIDDGEIERWALVRDDFRGDAAEDVSPGDQIGGIQTGTHTLENRP